MESKWKFFKRSKKKKDKNKNGETAAGFNNNTASCGTSTNQAPSAHELGSSIPARVLYHAPHPTGYRQPSNQLASPMGRRPYFEEAPLPPRPTHYRPPSGAFTYGMPSPSPAETRNVTLPAKNLTRHDSLNDISNCSESVVAATCLQRSRSQPSVNCASKKSRKEAATNYNKENVIGKNTPKKSGFGSWLRKSLRKSKSKSDVSNKKRAAEEARDEEEYGGESTSWAAPKLTRSVSTSVVNNDKRNQGNPVFIPGGVNVIPRSVFEQNLPAGNTGGRHELAFHSLPASRPYVLTLPPRPKHLSLPPTPNQHMDQNQTCTFIQGPSTSIGLMRGNLASKTNLVNRHSSTQGNLTSVLPAREFQGSADNNNNPQTYLTPRRIDHSPLPQSIASSNSSGQFGTGNTATGFVLSPQPLRDARPINSRPPISPPPPKSPEKQFIRVRSSSCDSSQRHPMPSPVSRDGNDVFVSPNTSTPLQRQKRLSQVRPISRRSQTSTSVTTRSPSQSSDCPSTIAPSPPLKSKSGPRSPSKDRSGKAPISGPSGIFTRVAPARAKSPESRDTQSPRPSSSLASSSVSSVGIRRGKRELPPLPPKRHSLASTVLSITTTESVYHQITEDNDSSNGRNYPGLPWRPPHSPVLDRAGSVDMLDQSLTDDFGYLKPRQSIPTWGFGDRKPLRSGLQKAASHSLLDEVGKSNNRYSHNPQFTDLDHVKSAIDISCVNYEGNNPAYALGNSRTAPKPKEKPIKKSKSYHDVVPKKEKLLQSQASAKFANELSEKDNLLRYRSQPEIGGPGIQSRESLAFKPLSHTTSEDTLSSCSSDSDLCMEERRRLSRHRRRRRPKRRSASYNNLPEDTTRKRDNWPGLSGISKESSYMLQRWWATLDDIPTAVLCDGKNLERNYSSANSENEEEVSMATTASYIPGVSLADKLRLAASKGQLDKVKELVAAGATFVPDREGRTALHYAALNGYASVVSLLAAEGCDIDLQDNLGYTALHRAAAQGHLEVIRALLAEGCLVDRQDEVHGNAAIHEAAWNGYSRTLELLVKQRTHVSITNKAGFSALHLAAQNGHNQSARVLLYSNCNPDRKNNYGDTPLHTAARYGHAGVTRILISAKADVNQQNKNGDTALHISAALKRRKISKLLCDSPIDVSIKNKQNETAVDVARRKEHPEIILTITSKPKVKVKKSRFGRSRSRGRELDTEGDRKGEKKGFFFRKKKAKEKEKSNPALTAASEVSSVNPSAYAEAPPHAHLMVGYRERGREGAPSEVSGPQARGTSTMGSQDRVSGVLHNYSAKQGVKYYRDLAGNIKQGPVGFTAQCQCAPAVKRLETRVEADRANLYDHIDASHRTLAERIDQLDRRTAQQVYSIDKLTKERLEAERKAREEQIEGRGLADRLETERQLEIQADCVKTELKAWVDSKVTGLERPVMTSHDDGCDYLLNSSFNFGRDGLHQTNLFRSKSDETLSVSSSHPGKRTHKISARAAHELRRLQLHGGGSRSRERHEHRAQIRRSSGLRVHDRPTHDKPRPGAGEVHRESNGRPLGHSPEGQSTKNESFCEQGPPDRPLPDWIKPSPAVSTPRNFDEAEGRSYNSVNILGAQLRNLALSPVTDPSLEGETPPRPTPPLHFTPTQHGEPSPKGFTVLAQVHHAKTDSGSNPDSGYGGKQYTTRPDRPRSEHQHDTSLATNLSTTTDGTSATSESDPLHVTRHFFDTVSAQMEKWYERRLKEVEKKAEDRVKQESSAMQSRIQALEERFVDNKVKLGPQIEASIGTQV